jgi:hypothetical protein
MRVSLMSGDYRPRNVIANYQRCVNLFPEVNPKDAPVELTFYQRPGLVEVVTLGTGPIRQTFTASNGNVYVVSGQGVYYLDQDFNPTLLGSLGGTRTTPTTMTDNGTTLLLADGSAGGAWTINLANNAFAAATDSSGLFVGADKVDYLDSFILFNMPGTNQFGSTLSYEVFPCDSTYVATTSGYPGNIQTLVVNHRALLLLGFWKSELWYDTGGTLFPFAEVPGVYFEHGCAAKYSAACYDISTFWLGQNKQGTGLVLRNKNYEVDRISNHALEYQIRLMASAGTIDDAIGYCYQNDGHIFYVLNFPTGDQTWVFDDTTSQWHQRAWQDTAGVLHRERLNCCCFGNGVLLGGDWQSGKVYRLDCTNYQDDGSPVPYIRGFPHLTQLPNAQGQLTATDGKRVKINHFAADIDCGGALTPGAMLTLRYSIDRGHTWGTDVLQPAGDPGSFITQPSWRGLSGQGRDVVFELEWNWNGPTAINGAWVDGEVLTI